MVSDQGNIKRNNKLLKLHRNRTGYLYCNLCKYGKSKTISVSRLVALAFLQVDPSRPTVDHIDRNRVNNKLTNLQFANYNEQGLNRDYPVGVTGERYISRMHKGYKVQIRRNKNLIVSKYYGNLEDAITYRDICVSLLSSQENEEDEVETLPSLS